jgi:hypothetical protein
MYGGYLSGLNFPGVEGRLSRWEIVVNIVPLKEAIIWGCGCLVKEKMRGEIWELGIGNWIGLLMNLLGMIRNWVRWLC